MKTNRLLWVGIVSVGLVFGCSQGSKKVDTKASSSSAVATPENGASGQTPAGTVVETMDSGGYTYVRVDTGRDKIWAASPVFEVKVGDQVAIHSAMPMKDYHSSTLDRTFDTILFAQKITVSGASGLGGASATMPPDHPNIHTMSDAEGMDFSGIEKAEGGMTVAEVFAAKPKIAGKKVKVRGKVVKFTAQVMGKNWLHIQDGTGEEGTKDLTVTTGDEAAVGDVVMVEGTAVTDKDFGAGYAYAVLLEDASVKKE